MGELLLFGTIFAAIILQKKNNSKHPISGVLPVDRVGTYYIVDKKDPDFENFQPRFYMNGEKATSAMNFLAYDAECRNYRKDPKIPDTPYKKYRYNKKTGKEVVITARLAQEKDDMILHKRFLGAMIGEYKLGEFPGKIVEFVEDILEHNGVTEEKRREAWNNLMYRHIPLREADPKIYELIHDGIERYKNSCGYIAPKKQFDEEDVFCAIPFSI